ncbi:gap-Pol polyprotein [Clonorchis sinensis]|uniref:Gap-Pol polyprotein n=1 Tax=Clonorchis sinensis TaxID=79923 RepID=G7YQT8_CLOSI|nr:gap-Pol polyprotein [Clonorchis sinensis]
MRTFCRHSREDCLKRDVVSKYADIIRKKLFIYEILGSVIWQDVVDKEYLHRPKTDLGDEFTSDSRLLKLKNPSVWSIQLQCYFHFRCITSQQIMFSYGVSSHTTEVAVKVIDVVAPVPVLHPYNTLQAAILKKMTTSDETNPQKLFSGVEIGGFTPSQLQNKTWGELVGCFILTRGHVHSDCPLQNHSCSFLQRTVDLNPAARDQFSSSARPGGTGLQDDQISQLSNSPDPFVCANCLSLKGAMHSVNEKRAIKDKPKCPLLNEKDRGETFILVGIFDAKVAFLSKALEGTNTKKKVTRTKVDNQLSSLSEYLALSTRGPLAAKKVVQLSDASFRQPRRL